MSRVKKTEGPQGLTLLAPLVEEHFRTRPFKRMLIQNEYRRLRALPTVILDTEGYTKPITPVACLELRQHPPLAPVAVVSESSPIQALSPAVSVLPPLAHAVFEEQPLAPAVAAEPGPLQTLDLVQIPAPQPLHANVFPIGEDDPQYAHLIAPLNATDRAAVFQMWNVPEHSERVAASLPMGAGGDLVDILDFHMWRMRRGWLYDENINAYMWLLQQEDNRLCEANPIRLPCHFFSSFFFEKVMSLLIVQLSMCVSFNNTLHFTPSPLATVSDVRDRNLLTRLGEAMGEARKRWRRVQTTPGLRAGGPWFALDPLRCRHTE